MLARLCLLPADKQQIFVNSVFPITSTLFSDIRCKMLMVVKVSNLTKKINRRCSLIIYHAKRKAEKKEIKEVGENLINYVKKFFKNVITCPKYLNCNFSSLFLLFFLLAVLKEYVLETP